MPSALSPGPLPGSSGSACSLRLLRPSHRPSDHPPGPVATDLNDRHPWMVPAAPILGLYPCLELHRLEVRPGDDEVILDLAEGEGGHLNATTVTVPSSSP